MAPTTDILQHHPAEQSDNEFTLSDVPKERKVIGIDGIWYDVTTFITRHPGGEVLEHFLGEDATDVFRSIRHRSSVLKQVCWMQMSFAKPLLLEHQLPVKCRPVDIGN